MGALILMALKTANGKDLSTSEEICKKASMTAKEHYHKLHVLVL